MHRGRTGTPRCHHAQGLLGLHEFLSNEREREQEIQGVHGRAVAHELKMAASPPMSRVPKKVQKHLKGEVVKNQKIIALKNKKSAFADEKAEGKARKGKKERATSSDEEDGHEEEAEMKQRRRQERSLGLGQHT